MNPSAPSASARRAALLLHAMAPADRDWLLASLSPSQRERLQDLLRELRGLGIPADAPLLQALTREEPAPVLEGAVQRLELLSGHEVAWLADRLREEPLEISAVLLAHRAWPWRAALLERFDPVRRQGVEAGLRTRSLPLPGAALCEAVVRMLPEAVPAPPPSALDRLRGRLRLPMFGAFSR